MCSLAEEGFGLTLDAEGEPQFTQPNGWPLPMAPAAPAWTGNPLAPTDTTLAADGIVIDSTTSRPNWCGEGLDLPYVISVAWRPKEGAVGTGWTPSGGNITGGSDCAPTRMSR